MVRNVKKEPEEFHEKKYTHDFSSKKDLLQKEIDVLEEQKNLLYQRIALVKETLSDMKIHDPEYDLIHSQIQKDEIELDEIENRKTVLLDKLKKQTP